MRSWVDDALPDWCRVRRRVRDTRVSELAALAFGIVTVLVPFLTLQPALGLGIASANAPHPWKARLRSLATHAVFGAGLWVWAWVVRDLVAN